MYGRYCHLCGQENIEPKESFWHLVSHFVYDITHFDGKFFSTVKYLLLKPGFLSREYIVGRRMRYLNPIKMYVFVSAFFFLFFFSIIHPLFESEKKETERPVYAEIKSEIQGEIEAIQSDLKDKDISEAAKASQQHKLQALQQDMRTLARDSMRLGELNYFKLKGPITFGQYETLTSYDSIQNSLPPQSRDSWIEKIVIRKVFNLQEKYGNDSRGFFKVLFERFRHSFPQIFFVSLPLFALLLKLLYGRKKGFYYVDNVIYSVHLYCAMFILLFLLMAISQSDHFKYLHWLGFFTVPLSIYMIWYQYKSLRNFYDQGRLQTIIKYLLLLIMSSVVMTLLFIVFLVFSILNL